jgi:hypothetical protein
VRRNRFHFYFEGSSLGDRTDSCHFRRLGGRPGVPLLGCALLLHSNSVRDRATVGDLALRDNRDHGDKGSSVEILGDDHHALQLHLRVHPRSSDGH